VLGASLPARLWGRPARADFGVGVVLFGIHSRRAAVRSEWFALLLLGVVGVGNTLADVSG